MDRRFPRFGRGKGSLQRTVVAAAAVVLALAALGFLIWALVTGSAIRLAWLVAMATILAAVLPAWAMSAQMLAWVRRHRPAADRVLQDSTGAVVPGGVDVAQVAGRLEAAFAAQMAEREDSIDAAERYYVELLLRERPRDSRHNREHQTLEPAEAPLRSFASSPGARLLVFGEGGAGKTTALLKLGLDAARADPGRADAPIPVYAKLNLAGTTSATTIDGLIALLAEQIGVSQQQLHDEWLHGPRELLFLLDGLNEVRDDLEDDLALSIRRLMDVRRHRYVITSRMTAASDRLARQDQGLQVLEVVRLAEKQVAGYLAGHGLGQLDRQMGPQLRGLVRNPFMLWALVQMFSSIEGSKLPSNTGQLYRQFIDDYVFGIREPAKPDPGTTFEYAAVKRPALAALAAEMTRQGGTRLLIDESVANMLVTLLEGLGTVHRRRRPVMPPNWTVEDFLDEVVYNGILHRSGDTVSFMHESVQTYFTAIALREQPVAYVVAKVPAFAWRFVDVKGDSLGLRIGQAVAAVIMLAGIITDCTELVNALVERNLLAAAMCMGECEEIELPVREAIVTRWTEMLTQRDERVKWVACHCLWLARVESATAVRALLTFFLREVEEENWALRDAAGDALMASPCPEASDGLVEMALSGTGKVWMHAAIFLARQPDARLLSRLIDEWRTAESNERRVRTQLVIARLSVAVVRKLLPEVVRRLQDSGDPAGAAAAREVGASIEDWRRTMEETDSMLTGLGAAELDAVRQQGERERTAARERFRVAPIPDVLNALANGTWNLRWSAALALAERRPPEAVGALLGALWRERDNFGAMRMAEALANCGASGHIADELVGQLDHFAPVGTISRPHLTDGLPESGPLQRTLLELGLLVGDDDAPSVIKIPRGWRVNRGSQGEDLLLIEDGADVRVVDLYRRARAARALAKVSPDRARPLLAQIIAQASNEPADTEDDLEVWEGAQLVEAAVEAMAEAGDATSVPLLVNMLQREIPNDRSSLVEPLINTLAKIGAPEAIPAVFEALTFIRYGEGTEHAWRSVSISDGISGKIHEALEEFGAPLQIQEWLRRTIKDSSPSRREAAVRELGRWRTHPSELVTVVVTDPDPKVRAAAGRALRWYEDDGWLQSVIDSTHAPNPVTRESAARALGAIRDESAIAPLAAALHDHDERVRAAAAESLIALQDEATTERAIDTLTDLARTTDDPDVGAHAGAALLSALPNAIDRIPAPVLDAIVRCGDCSASVREQAFDALGAYNWEPFIRAMVSVYTDSRDALDLLSGFIATSPEGRPPHSDRDELGEQGPFFERQARWSRALAHANLGQFDQALVDAHEAEMSQYSPEDVAWLAGRLEAAGRRHDAMELLTEGVQGIASDRSFEDTKERRDEESVLRLKLGWLAYLAGKRETALTNSWLAAELGEGAQGAVAAFNLALAQLAFAPLTEAREAYTRALDRIQDLDVEHSREIITMAVADLDEAVDNGRVPPHGAAEMRALLTSDAHR